MAAIVSYQVTSCATGSDSHGQPTSIEIQQVGTNHFNIDMVLLNKNQYNQLLEIAKQ